MVSCNQKSLIVVWGARRSGTNYLEALLLRNTTLDVANLNRAPDRGEFAARRPWLYEELGSKHSIKDAACKFLPSAINVAIIRNPKSWIEARVRYFEIQMDKGEGAATIPQIRTWIEQEYNQFYRGLLAQEIYVVTYEALLSKPLASLEVMGRTLDFKLSDRFEDVDVVLQPGGGRGRRRDEEFFQRHLKDTDSGCYREFFTDFDRELLLKFFEAEALR